MSWVKIGDIMINLNHIISMYIQKEGRERYICICVPSKRYEIHIENVEEVMDFLEKIVKPHVPEISGSVSWESFVI